jgi:putative PEP-CTERM system TPR-repeat lipoprotein
MAGEAELRLGDPAAAEAHFKAAAQLAPDDTQLRTAVALANLTRGDPSTAFNELESLAASSKDSYADQGLIGARMKRLEYDAALAAAERMNRKLPGQALGYELLGRIQVARKQYGPARLAFEQALKLDPGLFAATASLAAMDLIEKNPAQARQRLEAATEADPRNPFALMALAELKASTGAPIDESKTLLAQAIKAAPSEAAPRLQLIELLLKKRLYKEALAAAQEAAVALPGDVHVLDTVGRAQMEAGDVEQSIGTFRRLAAASPKSALAYTRLADVFKASGRREQSEVVLRKALEIEPDLEQAQVELVNLLVAGNRANDALEFTRHLQRDRPKQPAGYWLEAWVHFKSHRPDAAVATLRAGLAKLEGSSSLARSLYKTLTDIGRQAEADQFGTAWMKAHPKDLAFDYELASSDIRRHRLEQAEARLLRIVAARPDHPLALNNLAWVLAARGRPGAVGYAQRAVDLLPRRPALMDTLALALAAEKQPDKALAMQKEAVELAPTDNGLHLGLARIALQAGDKVLARKELERLLALGPAFTARADVEQLMKEL